jgi:hypothetical protein
MRDDGPVDGEKIARFSTDSQGFSNVPHPPRQWQFRFSSPESPNVRKSPDNFESYSFRTRQFERIEFSAAFWLRYLDSELVFVGDEGTTEASDATKRCRFELFTRIKLLGWLWLTGDYTDTTAEFRGTGAAIP